MLCPADAPDHERWQIKLHSERAALVTPEWIVEQELSAFDALYIGIRQRHAAPLAEQ
jgi:hypothetical protein